MIMINLQPECGAAALITIFASLIRNVQFADDGYYFAVELNSEFPWPGPGLRALVRTRAGPGHAGAARPGQTQARTRRPGNLKPGPPASEPETHSEHGLLA